MNLNAEADRLEAHAHMLEQWMKPVADTIKAMRDVALNLRRAGKPAPAG